MNHKMKKNMKSLVVDAMAIWEMRKPRYNGYSCGYGIHGNTKYSRKQKHKNRDYEGE